MAVYGSQVRIEGYVLAHGGTCYLPFTKHIAFHFGDAATHALSLADYTWPHGEPRSGCPAQLTATAPPPPSN
jgi:hypothetical protein